MVDEEDVTDETIDAQAEYLAKLASLKYGGKPMSVWPYFERLKKKALKPISPRRWRIWSVSAVFDREPIVERE